MSDVKTTVRRVPGIARALVLPAALALVALPALAPRPLARVAHAGDSSLEQAKDHYGKGEKAYALGKFEEALAHYERAYELAPLPELLFNMGQCQRNLGHWERAAFFYEGYLKGNPKAKNRPSVEALIEQMNAKVEEEKRARPVAPSSPTAPAPTPTTPAPAPAVVAPEVAAPAAEPAEKPKTPIYKRWYVWTIFGVVAAGAVGAGVGAAAAHPSTDYDNLRGSLGILGGPPGAQ